MKADWMASISLDLSGGSGSVECQANFNFQVSLVYFPIQQCGVVIGHLSDGEKERAMRSERPRLGLKVRQ